MSIGRRIVLAIVVVFLCLSRMCAAATRPIQVSPASESTAIQLSPESSFLDLDSTDRSARLRQTSTPVRITVTGAAVTSRYPIELYACVASEVAMRLAGKTSTLATATLRIRNDHGVWAELTPLPELEGRRGVRIAVVNGASATILLQVQLQVPAGQAPGNYQGTITLEAQ